jgi:hypothetical protein
LFAGKGEQKWLDLTTSPFYLGDYPLCHIQVSDLTHQILILQQDIQKQWHHELQPHAHDQSHHPNTWNWRICCLKYLFEVNLILTENIYCQNILCITNIFLFRLQEGVKFISLNIVFKKQASHLVKTSNNKNCIRGTEIKYTPDTMGPL